MTGQEFHEIELRGCTEEPLINYLKALGIFRIVHKQKDKSVKGYWKNGYFCMKTVLSPEELEKFFLEEYAPSPFFIPWGAKSGFWPKKEGKKQDDEGETRKSLERIVSQSNNRYALFRQSYNSITNFNKDSGIKEKPEDKEKQNYIVSLRSYMPSELREWIDACYVISNERNEVMLLLGTGGNEGNSSYSKNYLVALETVLLDMESDQSQGLISDSFFAVQYPKVSIVNLGQLNPNFQVSNLSNPWDFIFSLEGCMLFAGSATKRYNQNSTSSFPFLVSPSVAGLGHLSENKRLEFNKEFWMPIWCSPSRFQEVETFFAEGKVDYKKRPADNGLNFALAISSLGVDRGIISFNRYGRLARNGQNNIAVPLGKFKVERVQNIDLISDFSQWLESLRRIANKDKTPAKYRRHLRRVEDAIFRFAKYGGATNQQNVLIELGKAELSFSSSCPAELKPLQSLSPKWISACDDGSCEYRIACSLASICNQEIGHVREQLEPVKLENHEYVWKERKPLTWNSSNLTLSLIGILKRRLIEQNRNNTGNPLESGIRINSDDVIQFLEGNVDDLKIADLFFAFSTLKCEWDKQWLPLQDKANEHHQNYSKCYNAYALLKLVFPDGPYEMNAGKLFVKRNNHNPDTAFVVKANPEILSLFSTHPDKAIETASRRLRTHGLIPLGTMRNRGTSIEFNLSMNARDRILAALLIPIYDYNSLANAVLRIDSTLMEIETTTHNTEVLT